MPGRHALPFEWPFIWILTETSSYGIVEYVAPFFIAFGFVSEAMIEKVWLPTYLQYSGGVLFPVCNGLGHRLVMCKCDKCVEMIGHEKH